MEGELPSYVYSWLLSPLRPAAVPSKAWSTEVSILLSAKIVGCVLNLTVRAAVDPQLGASLLLTALQMGLGSLRDPQPCLGFAGGQYLGLGIWLGP